MVQKDNANRPFEYFLTRLKRLEAASAVAGETAIAFEADPKTARSVLTKSRHFMLIQLTQPVGRRELA